MELSIIGKWFSQTICLLIPGNSDVSSYPVIIADTSNEDSLATMAKQAKVIINAVGPVGFYEWKKINNAL